METQQSASGYDVQTPLVELLGKVESGEEVVITREGTPVARLVPMETGVHSQQSRAEAIERITKLSEGLTLGGLKVRNMIDEGRP